MKQNRIAIIGAGPIGLEAALYAGQLGFEVSVFEKGRVGENIRRWGHVRLFSPWSMNRSPLAERRLLSDAPGWSQPEPEALLTGVEFAETLLAPLSRLPELAGNIYEQTEALSVGKQGLLKSDLIGDNKRALYPFRLLTRDKQGNETAHTADILIDASGVYGNPNWLGDGGIPAPGEISCRQHIDYHLRDICGRDRQRFAGKRTLLVGGGYSAATTVSDFTELIREEPATSLIWVIRGKAGRPIPVIENDPLTAREKLTRRANTAASEAGIGFRGDTTVESISFSKGAQKFSVALRTGNQTDTVIVDRVVANVGYGPDNSLYRELQMHECWASRGPMKLSAALLGANSSADCLSQTSMGADTLKNPEPNFYIIGNKSYGRNPAFLIQIGLTQIVEIFSLITGQADLNLYEEAAVEEGVTA